MEDVKTALQKILTRVNPKVAQLLILNDFREINGN